MFSISVVIASVNGLPSIDECLSALSRQRGEFEKEIVVVDCCRDNTCEHIRRHFPDVQLIEIEKRLGIPQMRALGIARARGDLIAITEDHCIAPPDWLRKMVEAHTKAQHAKAQHAKAQHAKAQSEAPASDYAAIGGAIENGSTRRLVDRAVFLCEYSGTMPPIARGEVSGVAGNNVCYRRAWLERVDGSIRDNCWEYFIHAEMKRLGARFLSVPSLVISHKKEFGFRYFMAQRFHYSRSFAAMRGARATPAKRLAYACASPLLPFLMLWRMARHVAMRKRRRLEFVLCLPLLMAFMLPYALGEMTGYLWGAGNSLEHVE